MADTTDPLAAFVRDEEKVKAFIARMRLDYPDDPVGWTSDNQPRYRDMTYMLALLADREAKLAERESTLCGYCAVPTQPR